MSSMPSMSFCAFYGIIKTFVHLMYATSLRVNIVPMNDNVWGMFSYLA